MEAGAYAGSLSRLTIPGADLFVERHDRAIHKYGRIPDDRCTVSVALQTEGSGWFLQRPVGAETALFLLPGGTEFDVYLAGETRTLYVAFRQAELLAALRALDPGRWEAPPGGLLGLDSPRQAAFVQTALTLLARVRRGEAAALTRPALHHRLLHTAAMAFNGARPADGAHGLDRRGRGRRLQTVRRAREFMHGSLDDGHMPSVADVCAAAGVSERTLEYGFRALLGVTPVAYWRMLRLNRVREVLMHPAGPQVSVTDTATRCGFLHLGHFSRHYRRQFGEPPSSTLARALS